MYLLFEHKSYRSHKMALQLLRYMVSIWEQKVKASSLPLIIPLIFYHGKERWEISCQFSSLIQGVETFTDQLQAYVPNFEYLLYDLSPQGMEEIRGNVKLRVFWRS